MAVAGSGGGVFPLPYIAPRAIVTHTTTDFLSFPSPRRRIRYNHHLDATASANRCITALNTLSMSYHHPNPQHPFSATAPSPASDASSPSPSQARAHGHILAAARRFVTDRAPASTPAPACGSDNGDYLSERDVRLHDECVSAFGGRSAHCQPPCHYGTPHHHTRRRSGGGLCAHKFCCAAYRRAGSVTRRGG